MFDQVAKPMHVSSFNLPLVVLLPFVGALLAFTVARFNRLASAFSAALITLLAVLLLWPSIPAVWVGQTVVQAWSWLPNIGFNIAFRLDGLSLLFSLLILLIGKDLQRGLMSIHGKIMKNHLVQFYLTSKQ